MKTQDRFRSLPAYKIAILFFVRRHVFDVIFPHLTGNIHMRGLKVKCTESNSKQLKISGRNHNQCFKQLFAPREIELIPVI